MAIEQRLAAATGLAMLVALLGATDSIIVRVLTHDLHPFTIVFFRGLFGLLFVAPWVLRDRSVLVSNYFFLHLLRAALKLLSLAAFFIAISLAALADVTAIAFTTPVFLTIGAWFFLNERPVIWQILAVICSFIGMLVILQPNQYSVSLPLVYALVGALLTAIIQLILKKMSAQDSTETLVAWNLLATLPLAALPLYWFWTPPSTTQYFLLALQGAMGAMNMACMAKAMSWAQASYLAPIEFIRLPAVALLAFIFFAEVPSLTTLTGAAIIFASTLLLAGRVRGAALPNV